MHLSGGPEYDITDEKALREHIGEPAEASKQRWKFTKSLTEDQVQFIALSPFCLLSTLDADGVPCVSPKGDAPGFVQVLRCWDRGLTEGPDLLLFPERAGNKLIFTLQNVLRHQEIQILFMVPNTCETLRISGRATLTRDPKLCKQCAAGGQDALLVMRVMVAECYFHCAKAFIRSQLWKPETWPKERFKVKLGQTMAKNGKKDAKWLQEYEDGAAERLKAVEDHYSGKVWKLPGRQGRDSRIPAVCAATFAIIVVAMTRSKLKRM